MFEEAGAKLYAIFANFTVISAIDILLLAILFHFMFYIAKKYNSSFFILASLLFILVTFLTKLFNLVGISTILTMVCSMALIVFFVIFRSELRREMWKKSRVEKMGEIAVTKFTGTEYEIRECINLIIKACQSMSKRNVGALLIIVPSQIPMQIAESGVMLNCDLSSEIIENIFTPNTPLHDGAMLISGNKITAAGCFLPLTQDNSLPKDLGTRHRAGIGITEMSDVLAIIVSEETGVISLARRGVLKRYADADMMTTSLEEIYGVRRVGA